MVVVVVVRGKNPTEKPELMKVLKERQEKEKKKEMEEHLKSKRTDFDIRLEEQAQKINQVSLLAGTTFTVPVGFFSLAFCSKDVLSRVSSSVLFTVSNVLVQHQSSIIEYV